MGGPAKVGEVREYLYNIFSDRAIIRLPGGALFQKPFAHMISRLRCRKVQDHYRRIGGGSPLLKWTSAQAQLVREELAGELKGLSVYLGMRYSHPSTEEAVREALADGCEQLVLCPCYPHYSTATTESSFQAAERALKGAKGVSVIKIGDFHNQPDYIALLRSYILRHCRAEDTLLFSAHSLPQKFVDEGDPYVDQVRETARLVSGDREYFVSFQSRSGPVDWVGPDTIDETRRLLGEREGDLFLVPISFVSDHIETLYEIDIELKALVGDELGGRIRRMPMFNDDPAFGRALANVIREAIRDHVEA
jgi:ferrochelatase